MIYYPFYPRRLRFDGMARAGNRGEAEALGTRGVKLQSPPMPLPPPPPPPLPERAFMNGRRPAITVENAESASEYWTEEKYGKSSGEFVPPPPGGFHDAGDIEMPKVTLMRGDGARGRSIPEPDNDWGQGEKMQAHPPPPPPPPTSPVDRALDVTIKK